VPTNIENLQWLNQWEIMEGIAHVLANLHHDYISLFIHRNILCHNMLLDSTIQVYVSDFGIMKFLNVHTKSKWNKVADSFGYMTPNWVIQ
jgi:serine/threonine protein kinase